MHLGGNRLLDCSQRGSGACSIRTARLSHVGASAAAPAAERCGSDAGEFHCVEAAREVGSDANDDRRLPLGTGHNGDDARTNAPLQVIG